MNATTFEHHACGEHCKFVDSPSRFLIFVWEIVEANPSICECSTTKITGGQTCDEDGMADIALTGKSKFEREAQTIRANEQWARANPRSGL